ncbi:hypothetical protein ACIQPR_13765 [Streptomyces sp. NPDC091280]|uniref:hypothetical protein n=1 Tax=Streptomyces sp. NPDC091280 TaxID=3365984 RepID=UPI00380D22F5
MTSTEETAAPQSSVPAPRSGGAPELGDVAARLREFADRARADGTDTRVLDRIVGDLEAGGATLAGTDLVTAYPPDILLPDAPTRTSATVESWLGVLRDVLVFAPIALTWWRLRDALHAYDATKSRDPFLLGWARGFPEGAPPHRTTVTLGTSAIHVTLLIVLVVTLTLVVHMVQRSRDRRLSREDARRELGHELTLATFLLATPAARPAGKPLDSRSADRLGAQLNASTQQLETALRRASEEIVTVMESGPGSRIQTALDGWTKTVDELTALVRTLRLPSELAEDLIRIRQETARDEERLRASLDALVTDLRAAQETAGQEIHRHDLAVASVRELARDLGESLVVFTERTNILYDAARSVLEWIDRHEPPSPYRDDL